MRQLLAAVLTHGLCNLLHFGVRLLLGLRLLSCLDGLAGEVLGVLILLIQEGEGIGYGYPSHPVACSSLPQEAPHLIAACDNCLVTLHKVKYFVILATLGSVQQEVEGSKPDEGLLTKQGMGWCAGFCMQVPAGNLPGLAGVLMCMSGKFGSYMLPAAHPLSNAIAAIVQDTGVLNKAQPFPGHEWPSTSQRSPSYDIRHMDGTAHI